MQGNIKIALLYFAAISLVSVVLTVYDKIASKKFRKHRIAEKTLICVGIMGGAVAEYVTMKLIRHKTRHKKFMTGLPVIIVLQAILIIVILLYLTGEIRC